MRVVVFGSERHAHIWGLRNNVKRSDIILATHSNVSQFIMGEKHLTVVRVPKDSWKPPTFPCEERVKVSERAIIIRMSNGVEVTEVKLQ